MKKTNFFVILLILTMGSTMAFAGSENVRSNTETMAVPVTENKVMGEEINSMKNRLEEIRNTDKSEMEAKDKKELKKELKAKKKASGGIYIGAGTLLLAILLIAILV